MRANAHRSLLIAAALLLLAPALRAQTTGDIAGRIKDVEGGVLPGVTVEARSSALQGVRVATSDATGLYRLALLPPGRYQVRFTLASFASEERPDVVVSLAHETTLDLAMRPSAAEEITVSAPAVETSSHTLGLDLTSRIVQTLPTGRTYSSVVQVVPGVSSDANPENKDQGSITIYGSSGAENVFLIDGVNTTGIEYGFQGKELNYEFIEELDVKTGGYEAEFGRATGGIVNVITKSGGNDFHGDLFGYLDNDSLQAGADPVVSTGGTTLGFTKKDLGLDLGGYIIKDRLWFFGAFDRVRNTTESQLPGGPLAGTSVDSESTRNLASLKLTYRLSDGNTLVGTFFQDPREDEGAINDANHSLNGDPVTYDGRLKFGGRDVALRYEGLRGSKWVFSAQVSRHAEQNSVLPAAAAGDTVQLRAIDDDFFQTGGFGLVQEKEFRRYGFGGSVTRFAGAHKIKAGVEYEDESADVTKRMSGGQQVDFAPDPEDPTRIIYQHRYWTTADATVDDAPLSELRASPSHHTTTLYLQDGWGVRPDLTLNVGLRWDRQAIIDAAGTKQIDLKHDFAPRLGAIWDPTKDHRTKVFASFGRFYEQLPMDLVIRSFSFERQPRIVNFDPTSNRPDPVAEAHLGTDSAILGGFTEPSDPDIRGQYVREVIVGGEREVVPDWTLGVKGVFRSYGRVIEDFLCQDDGTYCIGNPGQGIFQEVFTLDYSQTFAAPKPKRSYKGVQVDVRKRLANNWQGLASYVYSKVDGNYDGEYAPFTNVGADPNISAAYDYYDFFTDGRDLTRITNNGPLSNDRRHQLKLSGVYFTPWKLSLGLAAYFRTGTPVTRYGYSDAYGRYEFFLTERGAEGRTPSNYDLDLHLGYPLGLKTVTANILLDVFNLFNTQRPILLDQRWGFTEADNASPVPVNPGYKRAVLRSPPTSARLGLRVSF